MVTKRYKAFSISINEIAPANMLWLGDYDEKDEAINESSKKNTNEQIVVVDFGPISNTGKYRSEGRIAWASGIDD